MKIIETGFNGLLVIKPTIHSDSRGYFFESYNQVVFQNSGISFSPVQDNESKSSRDVIRGLHYQLRPFDQAKLIRVIEGKILDVALDHSCLTRGALSFEAILNSTSKASITSRNCTPSMVSYSLSFATIRSIHSRYSTKRALTMT